MVACPRQVQGATAPARRKPGWRQVEGRISVVAISLTRDQKLAISGIVVAAVCAAGGVFRDYFGWSSESSASSSPVTAGTESSAGSPACLYDPNAPTSLLRYRCDMVWNRRGVSVDSVPVYMAAGPGQLQFDQLDRSSGPQYFACEIQSSEEFHDRGLVGASPSTTRFWALTQGDNRGWGFVPEVFFDGAVQSAGDPNLPACVPDQISLAGRRPQT